MEYYSLKTKKTEQKIKRLYTAGNGLPSDNILSVAFDTNGALYVGTDSGLCLIEDGKIKVLNENSVQKLDYISGKLYASCGNFIFIYDGTKNIYSQDMSSFVAGVKKDENDNIWLSTTDRIFRYTDGRFINLCAYENGNVCDFTVCGDGKVYSVSKDAFYVLHGKRNQWSTMTGELTGVPHSEIKTLTSDSLGYIWTGCSDGIYIYDGHNEWLSPAQLDLFPQCTVNKIIFDNNNILLATEIGIYSVSDKKTSFLGAERYIPDKKVKDIAVSYYPYKIAAATEKGLSVIEYKDMTLSDKEKYFISKMNNFSRENLSSSRAWKNESGSGLSAEITDNDGLWTAEYVSALCYKYSLTGDSELKKEINEKMNALFHLQDITNIKGFPARAFRRSGEKGFGNGDPEWHLSSDAKGELEWKGETSSDELVGHYFAASCFYDYAADDSEKKKTAEYIKNITDHILANGYTLHDADGIETTWAHFGPEDLNSEELWCWEKGLNSLELLSFLSITYHMTGEEKYQNEINTLLKKHHYGMNILNHKKYDRHTCHIDDRLAFLITVPLLEYTEDVSFSKYVRLAMRRHFEYERVEHNPFFNFVFAAFSGSHADLDEAIRTLEDYPLDLNGYKMDCTDRPDIIFDEKATDFGAPVQSLNALPADERASYNMMTNAFCIKHDREGYLYSPSEWLLSYWFGKHYGFIS